MKNSLWFETAFKPLALQVEMGEEVVVVSCKAMNSWPSFLKNVLFVQFLNTRAPLSPLLWLPWLRLCCFSPCKATSWKPRAASGHCPQQGGTTTLCLLSCWETAGNRGHLAFGAFWAGGRLGQHIIQTYLCLHWAVFLIVYFYWRVSLCCFYKWTF